VVDFGCDHGYDCGTGQHLRIRQVGGTSTTMALIQREIGKKFVTAGTILIARDI